MFFLYDKISLRNKFNWTLLHKCAFFCKNACSVFHAYVVRQIFVSRQKSYAFFAWLMSRIFCLEDSDMTKTVFRLPLILLLSLVFALSVFAAPSVVEASDSVFEEYTDNFTLDVAQLAVENEGVCGDNLTWSFSDGTLTISGEGDMYDFESSGDERAPWAGNGIVIKNVVISDGVTGVGRMAFMGQSGIESVTFGKDVKIIRYKAFNSCVSLTGLYLNEGLETIGWSAFSYCKGLKEIVFPSTVKTVEDSAFLNTPCDNLYISDVASWFAVDFQDLASTPLKLAKNLYVDGVLTTKLEIPEGVMDIGENSLASQIAIKGLVLPSTLKYVYSDSLYIDSLENLYVFDIASYLNIGFYGEDWLARYADNIYVDGEIITDLVVPEGVTTISRGSFCGYEKLKTVTLSSTVNSVSPSAFTTSPIEKFVVHEDNADYSSDKHGVLFNKDKTTLLQYPVSNSAQEYVIPDSVKLIEVCAFESAVNLEKVTIPDSVEVIGDDAFFGASSLKEIHIPGSVKIVCDNAFEDCVGLEKVSFGEGVEEIQRYVFKNCSQLRTVTLSDSIQDIGDGVFRDCTSLESVTLPPMLTWISSALFYECTSLRAITIPEFVECVDKSAFYGCTELEDVEFAGENVEIIGTSAFYRCSFETFTIPETVTEIGSRAFLSCHNLKSITIPENVENMGLGAFMSCISLEMVTIESCAEIPTRAFEHCDNLKKVYVLADVDCIYKNSFDAPTFSIYGYRDSAAYEYANENNIEFFDLSIDINGDENTSVRDASTILRYLAGYEVDADISKMDVNGDGKVSVRDASAILRYLAGYDVTLN